MATAYVQVYAQSFGSCSFSHRCTVGGCDARSSLQDTQGNILLVGQAAPNELNTVDDETFTSYITEDNSDFACVKLSSSGEALWTWSDASADGTDWMVAAGTDSSDNVRIDRRRRCCEVCRK